LLWALVRALMLAGREVLTRRSMRTKGEREPTHERDFERVRTGDLRQPQDSRRRGQDAEQERREERRAERDMRFRAAMKPLLMVTSPEAAAVELTPASRLLVPVMVRRLERVAKIGMFALG